MEYQVGLKPKAIKDLRRLDSVVKKRLTDKMDLLRTDLQGDVKRLTNFVPEYRLRVGDWRILFEVTGDRIAIYRVLHRSEAYDH